MVNTVDLFEDVRSALGCLYISDIKSKTYIKQAKVYLKTMDLDECPLSQLVDMSEYLYGDKQTFADIESTITYLRAK